MTTDSVALLRKNAKGAKNFGGKDHFNIFWGYFCFQKGLISINHQLQNSVKDRTSLLVFALSSVGQPGSFDDPI